jgi:hypothetical protein
MLAILERNAERISRLEDIFAAQTEKREEVAAALRELRAMLHKRPR